MKPAESREAYMARWVPLYQGLRLSKKDAEERAAREWSRRHRTWTRAQLVYMASVGKREPEVRL